MRIFAGVARGGGQTTIFSVGGSFFGNLRQARVSSVDCNEKARALMAGNTQL